LLGIDLAVLQQGVDYQIAAAQRPFGIVDGRVQIGSLGQSRQQSRLGEGQLVGLPVEVVLRSRLESVDPMSQENLVAVQGKDLRLGETALDLDGEHHLLHLAPEGAVRAQEQVAGKLHGQGGSALRPAAAGDIAPSGPQNPPRIHAPMRLKILVFGGQNRVAQHLGKIFIRGNDPPLQGKRPDDPSLYVVKFGGGGRTISFQFADLGQIGRVHQEQAGQYSQHGEQQYQQAKKYPSYQLAGRTRRPDANRLCKHTRHRG